MPIDQAARHCGVSIGMLFTLESSKGVNLEHALGVMDGLGLTMVVVPKVHAPWLEQAAAHTAKIGQETACLAGRVEGGDQDERQGLEGLLDWLCGNTERVNLWPS